MTATKTIDLLAIAERCEKATGIDRELDYALLCIKDARAIKTGPLPGDPKFTASLDAAMTLVPEGWQVSEIGENWRAGGWHCTLAERPNEAQRRAYDSGRTYIVESEHGEAATPALALCAAALRAMEASNGKGDNP